MNAAAIVGALIAVIAGAIIVAGVVVVVLVAVVVVVVVVVDVTVSVDIFVLSAADAAVLRTVRVCSPGSPTTAA